MRKKITNLNRKNLKKNLLWAFAIIGLIAIIHFSVLSSSSVSFKKDTAYWLFSALSQTIAAFVALLFAGYAIVLGIMTELEQKDETLSEIHDQLKRHYYKSLKVLAYLTAVSIVSSLMMILFHGVTNFPFKRDFGVFSLGISIFTIIWGIRFVIEILNPKKYRLAAESLLRKKTQSITSSTQKKPITQFLETFILLETEVREYIFSDPRNKYVFKQGQSTGIRELFENLSKIRLIDNSAFEEFLSINEFRNLVVHGHIKEVDESWIKRISQLRENILSKLQGAPNASSSSEIQRND